MKALIFGINGQDGFYLSQALQRINIEVIGVSRTSNFISGDVADYDFVESIIKLESPDYIFHFEANSTTKHSALFDNHRAISTGTINILESARIHSPSAKIFLSGSAMQFKNVGLPINEKTSFDGSSPYSVERIQSVYAGRYFRSTFGLKVYVGYFFNHDSPMRSENHVNQKIVKAVQRISGGSKERLTLGKINVEKEFNFAGDVVNAVWKLISQDEVYEAIIGSGKAYSIQQWAEYCFKKENMDWRDFVVVEDNYKAEYEILVSDPSVMEDLGWRPQLDFYGLADLMMREI